MSDRKKANSNQSLNQPLSRDAVRANPSKTAPVESGGNQSPRRVLSLFDAVCIIVGTIIGSGIFGTAHMIANWSGRPTVMIGLWIAGGVASLMGAVCFAELMTRFPGAVGGDYVYLKKAFGRPLAFMFAWAAFWIIRPGNIAAMAMIFASYFSAILPIGEGSQGFIPYALMAVWVLSLANLIGLRQGAWVQNLLTSAKVVGILAIALLAFVRPAPPLDPAVLTSGESNLWLAMVFVMFTYGGWNDVAMVAGEVKNPQRNLLRSIILGTIAVTVVYVTLNLAFLYGLGYGRVAGSSAVATDVMLQSFGETTWLGRSSGALISALICISCLGAINGMIITSPRIYYAAGRDFSALSFLSKWSGKRDVPWQATLLQAIVATLLIGLCWMYENAFEVVVVVTAPYFWSFLGLAVISLFIFRSFRKTESNGNEEVSIFSTPFYPIPPILFLVVCGGLLYNSIDYMIREQYWTAAGIVAAIMAVGVVLGLVFGLGRQSEVD